MTKRRGSAARKSESSRSRPAQNLADCSRLF
ncbi:hypothetical protein [Enterobacter phage N5822]|nr:hypothetical protein [Enterobacter phage N5822]